MSRILYNLPSHRLTHMEDDQINVIIRRTYKRVESSQRIRNSTGLHNTFEEILKGLISAQKERFISTTTGRAILWKAAPHPNPPKRKQLDAMTDMTANNAYI